MNSNCSLKIFYKPTMTEDRVRFLIKYDDIEKAIPDDAELKAFEGKSTFSLSLCADKVFSFILENFDGLDAVSIIVNVYEDEYKRCIDDFEDFEKAINKFNRVNTAKIDITYFLDINSSASDTVSDVLCEQAKTNEPETQPPQVSNVILVGMTGSGKSTLINAVIGENVANTGKGQVITKKIEKYDSASSPFSLWDTVGITMNNYEHLVPKLEQFIKYTKGNSFDAIWYCINQNKRKLSPLEFNFIKRFSNCGIPLIICITEAIDEDEIFVNGIKMILNDHGLDGTPIFELLASEWKGKNGRTIPPYGKDDLINATMNITLSF